MSREEEKIGVTVDAVNRKNEKSDDKEAELTEEEQAMKDNIELAISRLQESDSGLQQMALDFLASEIKAASSLGSSAPLILKMLLQHFHTLEELVETYREKQYTTKKNLADVVAALALVHPDAKERQMLHMALEGSGAGLALWGHAFARALAGQVAAAYQAILPEEEDLDEFQGVAEPVTRLHGEESLTLETLEEMIDTLVPVLMTGHAEVEAIDLLLETAFVSKLTTLSAVSEDGTTSSQTNLVDDNNYGRVMRYLIKAVDYLADPEEQASLLKTAYDLACQGMTQALASDSQAAVSTFVSGTPETRVAVKAMDALRVALKAKKEEWITDLFNDERVNTLAKNQMALMLARLHSAIVTGDEELDSLIGNNLRSEAFLATAGLLDQLKVRRPDDVYKGVSPSARKSASASKNYDSATSNLASTFVNAFANAGFGCDAYYSPPEVDTSASTGASAETKLGAWPLYCRDTGRIAATAGLGLVHLWRDMDAFQEIDPYLAHDDPYIKAGAHLAIGVAACGVRNECDVPLSVLSDSLDDSNPFVRKMAALALGIAYHGQAKSDVSNLLDVRISNTSGSFEEVALSALGLGLSFVGSANQDVGMVMVQRLMDCTAVERASPYFPLLALSLGLVFLGRGEAAEWMMEVVMTLEEVPEEDQPAPPAPSTDEANPEANPEAAPTAEDAANKEKEAKAAAHKSQGRAASVILEACAFSGTGNVLKVQSLLQECTEHLTENALHQSLAVLGLAMIALGEEVGGEMIHRTFGHLLVYGESPVRRVVPLALALGSLSNPVSTTLDQLSRLTHDTDDSVAQNAILALGLVSAGTTNARAQGMLRQLADFYKGNEGMLFSVRLSQALNSMGRGLLTISPLQSDRLIINSAALGAILPLLVMCTVKSSSISSNEHNFLIFALVGAIAPRVVSLITPAPADYVYDSTAASKKTGGVKGTKGFGLDASFTLGPTIGDGRFALVRIPIRVGLAVETVGQAGKPRTITGFQTHIAPAIASTVERTELAGPAAACSPALEDMVLVQEIIIEDPVSSPTDTSK